MKVYNTVSQSRIRNVFYDRFHSHIRFQITMVRADYTFIVRTDRYRFTYDRIHWNRRDQRFPRKSLDFSRSVLASIFNANPIPVMVEEGVTLLNAIRGEILAQIIKTRASSN